jgi:L-alanine-DL-glutamate epimerase-like enolase superfamily enzyme
MFIEDPVTRGISYDQKGVITVPEVPGLGAEIDEEYLNGLEKVVV